VGTVWRLRVKFVYVGDRGLNREWDSAGVKMSLPRFAGQELVSMSASKVAKTVGKKAIGIRQAGFPAIDRGTQGYAKLFRGILNDCPVG